MNLMQYYDSILKAAGHIADKDGYISNALFDPPRPAMIEGKRLVLPFIEHQRNAGIADIIVFHPLHENLIKGPSTVVEHFRKGATLELTGKIGALLLALLDLCGSSADHSKLSPEQSQVLSLAKKVDERSIKDMRRIIERTSITDKERSIIRIFLKKGGKLEGKAHRQAGIVHFPLYEALLGDPKGERDVFGVKLRIHDYEQLRKLMEYIFPNIEVENTYSYGSDSTMAPKFDAIAGAIAKVAESINGIIELMEGKIKKIEPIESEWAAYTADNFVNEIRAIPPQPGNEGSEDRMKEGFIQIGGSDGVPNAQTANAPSASSGVKSLSSALHAQSTAPVASPVTSVAPVAGLHMPGTPIVGQGVLGGGFPSTLGSTPVAPVPAPASAPQGRQVRSLSDALRGQAVQNVGTAAPTYFPGQGLGGPVVPPAPQSGFGYGAPFGYYGGKV